jgi:hypothetical protein
MSVFATFAYSVCGIAFGQAEQPGILTSPHQLDITGPRYACKRSHLPLSKPDYYDAETRRYMPTIATVLPIFLPLSLPTFGQLRKGSSGRSKNGPADKKPVDCSMPPSGLHFGAHQKDQYRPRRRFLTLSKTDLEARHVSC